MQSTTTAHALPLILVTGASGLLGRRVLEDLAHDYRVVGMDLEAPEQLPQGVAFISCDLTDDSSVAAALRQLVDGYGSHIASVVHLASYYDFSGSPSPLYQQLTIEGTRRLLRELRHLEVEQFVFSSTILVMRNADPGDVLTEDSPVEGSWDFPWSKIEAETVVMQERGNIPAVVLRLAGIYDEWGHSPPLSQQIARIYESTLESHLYPGDESRGQPFVHIDDAVAAIRRTIERRFVLRDYEVMFVAEPKLLTYGELQNRLGQLIHGKDHWTTLRIPTPLAKVGAWVKEKLTTDETFMKPWMIELADTHLPISTRRVEELLGWEAKHRLGPTLAQMVEHLRGDPDRFYRENQISR